METSILFFGDTRYPFLAVDQVRYQIIQIREVSELFGAIRNADFDLILLDTGHHQFARPLIQRIYRRTPMTELWLVGGYEGALLPHELIDQSIPADISPADFEAKISAAMRVRDLLKAMHLVGKSANLKRAAELIAQVAPTKISTLIIGPSGSGKELVARAVHEQSPRRGEPFIAVNCGALTESLLESELFGHEKGSFTGAVSRREGIFRRANGGTVFLDEIGETSPALQVKLLRALEEGAFYRVGGEETVRTDIRVLAATNRDLNDAIADSKFREDLYFRLSAFRISLSGLAERKADILPLLYYFAQQQEKKLRPLSERAVEIILNYNWPGNVRQLRNFVGRMALLGGSGEISEPEVMQYIEEQGFTQRHLPVVTGQTPHQAEFQLLYQALLSLGQEVRSLRDLITRNLPRRDEQEVELSTDEENGAGTMDNMEESLIRATLEAVGGNRREAARQLGIGERTLYRKLKKYGDL